MTNAEYVPQRGDIVWILLRRPVGAERVGREQALVLSPGAYNAQARLVLLCPVRQRADASPYVVPLPPGLPVQGLILADQVCSVDWETRGADLICRLPQPTLRQVQQIALRLLTG